jgi:hypothetical protein
MPSKQTSKTGRAAKNEAEALTALNVKMRRKGKAVQLIEAGIGARAKQRAQDSQKTFPRKS